MRSRWRWLGWPLLALMLGGCADAGYYAQALAGHARLLSAARPIPDWLADPATPPALHARLQLARQLRRYAVTDLGLPDNASYTRYADLHRSAVVWNVVAAPDDSLTPRTWCFVLAGCVSYRGYFDQAEAQALADSLRAHGLEVSVYGVPAYSTLGWSNAIGGDPLLNTFVHQPEADLARLLFHELAHQVVYVADDSVFNESFATAVERLGGAQWLAQHASEAERQADARQLHQRTALRDLARQTRQALAALYANPGHRPRSAILADKAEVMANLRRRYAELRARWQADGVEEARLRGTDAWVAGVNNATLAAMNAYDELVPGFEALHARVNGNAPGGWGRFYAAVRALAAQPPAARRQALQDAARP